MSYIRTGAVLDMSKIPDAVTLPISEDPRGVYSEDLQLLHIIDIESCYPLISKVNMSREQADPYIADVFKKRT